ncbi:hypothetical protein H4Q32_011928 [Labeo rohita]|uniref:ribonuclease H n=1 Tax=Labeo rohita TaxID=84645 RepID=A0ABQ8MKQ1_LABRO|nr:hypothetical protein H4Q32_011928 [Labeo rohita]
MSKVYPLSILEQKAMEDYTKEALKQKFQSTSPAPWIQLHRVHIFSELVLWSTYNLIQVHEGEEWKTVFITPSGHYEYLVMPYGFANSPSAIHGLMNVFWEYLDHFIFIYIYTHLCTLDIYAASKPSYSSAICTGGPIWPRMSPNSSEVARSVPSKKCLQSCPSSICSIALGFPRILSQTEVLSSFTEYGYHPQTNGQIEHKIQELGRYLWSFCHSHQHSWSYLSCAK